MLKVSETEITNDNERSSPDSEWTIVVDSECSSMGGHNACDDNGDQSEGLHNSAGVGCRTHLFFQKTNPLKRQGTGRSRSRWQKKL